MKNESDQPLTPEEFGKMLRAVDLVCQNMDRWLNQGVMVMESLDDERVKSSRNKIDSYRDGIRREQNRIRRLQSILKRRSLIQSKRKQ